MRAYFKVKDQVDEIKVSTGYDLGGYNGLSGLTSRRGYYIYIQPVKRSTRSESTTLFDGFKKLVKEVSKRSKKAETEAFSMDLSEFRALAEDMAAQKGWTLTDDAPEIKED